MIDLSGHVTGLNILRGQYGQDEIRFVRGLLKPGDVAIDVGGHIGFFTMHMAAAVGDQSHAQLAAFGYRAHRMDGGEIGAPLDRTPADALVAVVPAPHP